MRGLRSLLRGSALYGLGSVINRAMAFLLLPLFTRFLTPAEYGVSALLSTVSLLLYGLFSLGSINSLGIFYFEESDPHKRGRLIWTTALMLGMNSAALVTLASRFAAPLSRLILGSERPYLLILALSSLALQVIADPLWSFLRMEERAKMFVTLSVTSTFLTLAMNVALVVGARRGVAGLFEGYLVGRAVTLILLIVTTARSIPFRVSWRNAAPILRVGFPSIFGLGAFYIIDYADRMMLQRMVGMSEVGIYSVGYNIGMMMALAVDSFGSAWPPYYMSFIKDHQAASRAFARVLKYYVAGFGGLTLLFIATARPMVVVMTGPAFHAAYTVVAWVATAYFLKGCYLIMLPGLYFAKRLHWQAIVEWLAAAVTIALNLLLIPMLKKEGAAIATCIAYLSLPVVTYFIASRYLAVKYDWRAIGMVSGAMAIAALLMSAAYTHGMASGVVVSITGCAAFALIVLRVVLQPSERSAVFSRIAAMVGR